MLYKYLSPERLSVIDDFKIRFTQPSHLNDPFEAAPLVNTTAYEECEKIIEALSEDVQCDTDEERAELEAVKAELKEEARARSSPQKIGEGLTALINKAQGVLSLSRTNDSLLMWAHYADSHRGYVLGLDETHPFFNRPDGNGQPTKPRNVIYTSRRMVVEAGRPEDYEQLLCYKSLEWAYEQEVRVFSTFGPSFADFEKNHPDQIHLFRLPRECIKEIYIGANASSRTRARILESVDRRKLQVKVFDAYVAEDRYALNFREVAGPIHSHRPREVFVRNVKAAAGYTDSIFAYNGLPTQITVDYGPGVVFPPYTPHPDWG